MMDTRRFGLRRIAADRSSETFGTCSGPSVPGALCRQSHAAAIVTLLSGRYGTSVR
jgi:hypothetical protein